MHQNLKDYYHILGVDQSATSDEIKRAYRKLAVKYHPDHNPGDKSAEEKFKLISEAYAVLANQSKRAEFDQARTQGGAYRQRPEAGPDPRRGDFQYSREDLFREMFSNAYQQQMFKDLAGEFRKAGFRFDERFFDRVFFGGRGFFFGGVYFSGGQKGGRVHRDQRPDYRTSFSQQARSGRVKDTTPPPPVKDEGVFKRLGRGLKNTANRLLGQGAASLGFGGADINFNLTISPVQAQTGADIDLVYRRDGQPQRLSVKVPAGIRNGARLRLKNMGHISSSGKNGDLFLHVRVA
jgi:curved DNA-binding protein